MHDETLQAQCTHITLILYSSSTALKTFASVKSWKQQYELPQTTKKRSFRGQRRGIHQVHCPRRWGLRESRQRIIKQTAQTPPQSFHLWFDLIRNGEDGIVVNVLHSKANKWAKMKQSKSRQPKQSLWNGGLGGRLQGMETHDDVNKNWSDKEYQNERWQHRASCVIFPFKTRTIWRSFATFWNRQFALFADDPERSCVDEQQQNYNDNFDLETNVVWDLSIFWFFKKKGAPWNKDLSEWTKAARPWRCTQLQGRKNGRLDKISCRDHFEKNRLREVQSRVQWALYIARVLLFYCLELSISGMSRSCHRTVEMHLGSRGFRY